MKKDTIEKLKIYLQTLKDIETQIEEEKDKQEKLEKQKKLLEAQIQTLEIRSKNIDSRISEIEFKIQENKKLMKRYNRHTIQRLAQVSFPISMATFIGSLIATRGVNSLFNLGSLASSLGISVALSYTIYSMFMNAYQHREKENEFYANDIKKLLEEKEEITKEITNSKKQILDIKKQITISKDNTINLENKLVETIKDWNENNAKEIRNIPLNSQKSNYQNDVDIKDADKIQARVLKLIPKEIQKELEKAA